MVEKVEIEGADKRMQTAASATLETTEGCPQREDDQKENQPDSNNDEDYKLEKEGYGWIKNMYQNNLYKIIIIPNCIIKSTW